MIFVYNGMNGMNGMNGFRAQSIISSVLSIIFGTIISLLAAFAFEPMVNIIFFTIGLGIIFSSIGPLMLAINNVGRDSRFILDLILSIISIILGIMFMFEHGMVLSIIFGVYLIIMPTVRIILSNNKLMQLKSELPLYIAAILLFFNVASAVLQIALIVIGAILAVTGVVNLVIELIKSHKDKKNNPHNDDDFFSDGGNGAKRDDSLVIDAEVRDL